MSESKPKLVPCPFCGETQTLVVARGAGKFCIACYPRQRGGPGCYCEGPIAVTEKEAVRLWNKRNERAGESAVSDAAATLMRVADELVLLKRDIERKVRALKASGKE